MHPFFEDETKLLYSSKSKDINQEITCELKNIVHWPRTNKISFKAKKTEIILFRTQKTIIYKEKYEFLNYSNGYLTFKNCMAGFRLM